MLDDADPAMHPFTVFIEIATLRAEILGKEIPPETDENKIAVLTTPTASHREQQIDRTP
ncbi:hypothetical protein [Streptomyces chartreusis]